MQVEAINGVYQYTSVYQAQFLPSNITNEEVNALMHRYGVKQTGNEYADLKSLYEAMFQDIARNGELPGVQTEAQKGQGSQVPPWAYVMQQIGLNPTGSFSSDYSLFMNTLNSMQASAKTPAEKSKLNLLQQMAAQVFIQPPVQQTENQIMQLTGSEIISQMNRISLLR